MIHVNRGEEFGNLTSDFPETLKEEEEEGGREGERERERKLFRNEIMYMCNCEYKPSLSSL